LKQISFIHTIESEIVDVFTKTQLSSVLRHVTPDGSEQERFIRFSEVLLLPCPGVFLSYQMNFGVVKNL
jgi:hypothetical protein